MEKGRRRRPARPKAAHSHLSHRIRSCLNNGDREMSRILIFQEGVDFCGTRGRRIENVSPRIGLCLNSWSLILFFHAGLIFVGQGGEELGCFSPE